MDIQKIKGKGKTYKRVRQIIKNKKIEILLSLIILTFLTIKIYNSFNTHNIIWDEAIYIGMGKSFYSFGTSGIWDMIRPILYSLIIGIPHIFNQNIIQFAEIITTLFAAGNIILTYLISKQITNKHLALFGGIMITIVPIFYLFSSFILTNIPSTFFTLLATYYFLKRKYFWTGTISALAFLTRFPQGLILLCFFITIFLNSTIQTITIKKTKTIIKNITKEIKEKYLPLGLSFLLTLIPFFILNYFSYIDREKNIIKAIFSPIILGALHQNNAVSGNLTFLNSISYYPKFLINQNILFILIIIAIFFFIKNKDYKNYKINTIFIITTIYSTYYSYIPNKQERFALAIIPYLIILLTYSIYSIYKLILEKTKEKNITIIKQTLTILLIVLFILSTNISSPTFKQTISGNYPYWHIGNQTEKINHYSSFKDDNLSSYIVTVDPIYTAYDNNLYIPYLPYFKDDIEYFNKTIKNADIIILSNAGFNYFNIKKNDTRILNTNEIINKSFTRIKKKDILNDKYKFYQKNIN